MTPQDSNLTDWVGDHRWAMWLSVSLLLASAEMLTLDLTLLMLAGGALAGALTSLIFPTSWLIQFLVAGVTSIAMLRLLRPSLVGKLGKGRGYRNSIEKLVGSQALATEEVTSTGGHVKVEGDTWMARTPDPSLVIASGEACDVYQVDGTTLMVYPREAQLPPGLRPYGQYGAELPPG